MVDDEDFKILSKYRWYLNRYAYTDIKGYSAGMHRILLGLKKGDGKQIDHINRNPLDNRRCNLRICTQSENNANRRPEGGISKYKGVYWSKVNKKWRAMIQKDNKKYHIGLYKTEEEASQAYNLKAKELFGDFACIR